MTEKNMKISVKNVKFSKEKQSKCFLFRFRNVKASFLLLIITEKTVSINRVSIFSLIHHLATPIWLVPNFQEIKVDPATL